MSRTVHLTAKNVAGVSGKSVTATSLLSHADCMIRSQVKIRTLSWTLKGASFVCEASSSDDMRNSDLSRQKKRGFSRGRNKQNEDRDSFEDDEEPELDSLKSGPFLSISNTPSDQATATPEAKEAAEMFRKLLICLGETPANKKEEKKVETPKEQSESNGEVDSLLELLGKHLTEEGKIREVMDKDLSAQSGGVGNGMASHGSPDPIENYNDGENLSKPVSRWIKSVEGKKYLADTLAEPEQEPEMKSDLKFSSNGDATSKSCSTSSGSRKKNWADIVAEFEHEPEMKSDLEFSSNGDATSKSCSTSSGSRKKNWADIVAEFEQEPEMKSDLEFSSNGDATSKSRSTSSGSRKKNWADIVAEFEQEPEMKSDLEYGFGGDATVKSHWTSSGSDVLAELEQEPDLEYELDSEDGETETSEELVEEVNLKALKVPELRALAKSRGLKRTSKMKKSELLDLLSKV